VTAVDGMSFVVEPGRVTGFLGPNGAGKTTTLRMLLGLVTATAGTATIGGVAYTDVNRPARQVGAVLEAGAAHGAPRPQPPTHHLPVDRDSPRPSRRSTAHGRAANTWTGTSWFIEGDVADCFGTLDHQVMLSTLSERIHDNRFLRLVRNMLQAGYLEDWIWGATLSGAPQGGVASPILSNIYLHRLDVFVETVLMPQYNRGGRRARSPAYLEVAAALTRARRRGDRNQVRQLRQRMRSLPSVDPQDPGYRRLRYVRYADDTLLGFAGPKAEAEEIKQRLAQFLRDDLKLELSQDKTLITHARTGAARFLGYEITTQHNDRQTTRGQRHVNGQIGLRVPRTVIKAKSAPYLQRGEPARRTRLLHSDDHTIVATYGAEYRGIVQYYLLAGDVNQLGRLRWVMPTSLLKTLASKHARR
jgi:ABC-type dipeptide/oligopeptide/nickel transport system ATPase component